MSGRRITSAEDALNFVLAGNSTFTVVSQKTGARFTYRVRKSEDGHCYYVSLLRGADNNSDYTYMGVIESRVHMNVTSQRRFRLTQKSKVTLEASSYVAFNWVFNKHLAFGTLPEELEFWHAGRCGRCNRLLTVPASITSGIGPECARHVHRMPAQMALAV